ncbi:MAG: RDD family protein [Firmicutes bacterium]|nr:RDD family protein [Bacillota bacterium]
MAEKKTLKLSSRGRRFAAALIDSAIPMILWIVMVIVLAIASVSDYYYDDYYYYDHHYGAAAGVGIGLIVFLMLMFAYLIVEIVFYAKGQSIGKAILGMKVVSSKNGKPLGFWWMMFREFFVKTASSSVFMLGYIWILIDKRNRGWHDKILDTYVVDCKPVEKQTVTVRAEAAKPTAEPVVEPVAEPVAEPVVEQVVDMPADVTEADVDKLIDEMDNITE